MILGKKELCLGSRDERSTTRVGAARSRGEGEGLSSAAAAMIRDRPVCGRTNKKRTSTE